MKSKMDPPLKEKMAFFEQLDVCRNFDEESDTLSTGEQTLRRECKAFYATTTTASVSASAVVSVPPVRYPKTKLPAFRHRRTASDPVLKPANDELEVIAVTPIDSRRPDKAKTVPALTASCSIIPETERQSNKRLIRWAAHQPTRVLRSQSDIEPSPSISMAKRKRTESLQLAPESKQIFKGLRFFYIPNDDINPARRIKITKAREHGAIWTKNKAEATHFIVDKALSYDDIKSTLDDYITASSAVLVNDQYPIDCLRRNTVFDPNQTVEKYQYTVTGDPKLTEAPIVLQTVTQDSSTSSLKLKPRRDQQILSDTTPESTQKSNDLIPSSHPEEIQSLKSGAQHGRSVSPTRPFADELTACIDAVLDDPENHEYLDESDLDAPGLENKAPQNKKRRLRSSSVNNTSTDFGQDRFMCMRGGTKDKRPRGPNSDVIRLLEEMVEEHILSDDNWRVQSYRKAIATLRRQPKKIRTAKEAAALNNIGISLAKHIEEIVSTGRFEKLDEIRREPSREALKVFSNIYGVGVATAKKWVELGHRTLHDLRMKVNLSVNQKVGVDYYDDLLTRIPRAEVKALGDHVKDVAATIDPAVELIVGGSYRRGADSSGDIDLIMTKNGTSSTQDLVPFLEKLVEVLTKEGFLTAALASHRHDGGNKWHGCCVLPETAFPGPKEEYRPLWRRIDFLLVPETEIGAALIYFTGNDLFNRSMRLLARKKNMKLNHKGLFGAGVDEGKDERKIFEILGVQWREPHERWC
ncbi:hypothetical protein F5Y03DRAFT_233644 [Xylaria venustula]|nr:hypothetical protein F5Y03DRAFT_233644 [Xylaria venustula]